MKKNYLLVIPIVICLNFFLPRLMPGDPFLYLSVEDGNTGAVFSEEQIEQYKEYYGLDQPLGKQFLHYIKQIAKGDLGVSIFYHTSVLTMIKKRIPWTLLIVTTSLAISSILGTLLGTISAWHRNGLFDKVVYSAMMLISEIPSFLIGIFLLFLFAADLKWFPLSGGSSVFSTYNSIWGQIGDVLHHMLLPTLTLVITRMGNFYLLSRNSMLTVLSKDYIRTARGKGLKNGRIRYIHALRNSIPPVVMQVFLSFGALFGQAVLVENVFSYPGVGSLMREAVSNRDYALMQGIFFIMALTVLLMNFLSELVFKKLDPRKV